jgi:hypothetical protein
MRILGPIICGEDTYWICQCGDTSETICRAMLKLVLNNALLVAAFQHISIPVGTIGLTLVGLIVVGASAIGLDGFVEQSF